jgi:CRP-like cAMP-binding protein
VFSELAQLAVAISSCIHLGSSFWLRATGDYPARWSRDRDGQRADIEAPPRPFPWRWPGYFPTVTNMDPVSAAIGAALSKPTTVSVLRLDPDLGAAIAAGRREIAARSCAAEVIDVPRGDWDTGGAGRINGSGFGLLVLSGVLCRRVVQGRRCGAELIGPGDLLRPRDRIGEWSSIPAEASWQAVDRARLAILDAGFARRAAPFPEISMTLIRRGLLRSRYLAILIAIVSQPKVEVRLQMLFWHLADRFGHTRGESVVVPVSLTHSLLGELIAVRRPSVTTALSRLQERGILVRENGDWLLRGPVPAEFERLRLAGDE